MLVFTWQRKKFTNKSTYQTHNTTQIHTFMDPLSTITVPLFIQCPCLNPCSTCPQRRLYEYKKKELQKDAVRFHKIGWTAMNKHRTQTSILTSPTLHITLHLIITPASSFLTYFSLPHIMGLLSATISCTLSVHLQHHQFTNLPDARLGHHGYGTLAC